jgi:TPR repeat protein
MRQAHIGSWILSLSLLIPLTLHAQAEPPQQLIDAAGKGDPVNEWALGHFYLTSSGDRQKAYYWLKKAADHGQANAKIELDANFTALGTTPFGDAQKSGITSRVADAQKVARTVSSDMRLTFFKADSDSPPEYMFYSPMLEKQITIIDMNGTFQAGQVTRGQLTEAVPGKFIDLPVAIADAKGQGLKGDIRSAVLMVARPTGKPTVAVWTLMPIDANQHGNLAYFVGANDGKALALMDVSDGINGNDAQLQAIQDAKARAEAGNSARNNGGPGGGGYAAPRNSTLYPSPAQQYNRNREGGPLSTCGYNPGAAGCH